MPPLEVEHRPLLDDLPEAGHEPEDHHADAHQRQPFERPARIDDLPIGGDGDGVGQGIADDPFGGQLLEMGKQLRLAVEEHADLRGDAGILITDRVGGDRLAHFAPDIG